MYNIPELSRLAELKTPTSPVQRTRGLMRREIEDLKTDVGYDPAESIVDHMKKYRQDVEDFSTTNALEETQRPISRAQGLGVDALAGSGDWVETTAGVLRELEGFKEKPYYDVNAFRAGYGSDTYTTADGEVVPVTENSRVSREDAERDLNRRIREEFGARARSTAGEAWETYNPLQKAALTSIAYNYGTIPDRIASEVRSGDPQRVAQAIISLADDNDGINKNRRIKESEMMLYRRE